MLISLISCNKYHQHIRPALSHRFATPPAIADGGPISRRLNYPPSPLPSPSSSSAFATIPNTIVMFTFSSSCIFFYSSNQILITYDKKAIKSYNCVQ